MADSGSPSPAAASTPPTTSAESNSVRSGSPTWIPVAGSVFGGLTLLFFMAIVVASLFGKTIPPDSQYLVVVVLAIGGAMAAGFLGGNAAVNGQIPLPGLASHSLSVGIGGGVAVLVLLLLLGPMIVPSASTVPQIEIPVPPEISVSKSGDVILAFRYEAKPTTMDDRYQLKIQVAKSRKFDDELIMNSAGRIEDGQFSGSLGKLASGTDLWLRLAIFEKSNVVGASAVRSFKIP